MKNPSTPLSASPGLCDNIICKINEEKDLRKTSKLRGLFGMLLVVSCIALPFSIGYFAQQWHASGVWYFISTAITNITIALPDWKEFALSIFESFPFAACVALLVNIAVALFAVRLFLHKKLYSF